jgi:hypothetical protein
MTDSNSTSSGKADDNIDRGEEGTRRRDSIHHTPRRFYSTSLSLLLYSSLSYAYSLDHSRTTTRVLVLQSITHSLSHCVTFFTFSLLTSTLILCPSA